MIVNKNELRKYLKSRYESLNKEFIESNSTVDKSYINAHIEEIKNITSKFEIKLKD